MSTRLLYGTLVVLVAAAILGGLYSGAVTDKDVMTALLALFGTFLGALFAFRLNEHNEFTKEIKEQKAALNQALFVLIRQYNAMHTYAQYFALFPTPVQRAINLPAHKPPPYSDLTIAFQTIGFLLDGTHANILMRLMVEQERFHQALENIRLRNEFHVAELQPALDHLKVNRTLKSEAELLSALGERMFGTAMNYGEGVFRNVTENIQSLSAMHEDLFNVAKALFPADRFVKFVPNA